MGCDEDRKDGERLGVIHLGSVIGTLFDKIKADVL